MATGTTERKNPTESSALLSVVVHPGPSTDIFRNLRGDTHGRKFTTEDHFTTEGQIEGEILRLKQNNKAERSQRQDDARDEAALHARIRKVDTFVAVFIMAFAAIGAGIIVGKKHWSGVVVILAGVFMGASYAYYKRDEVAYEIKQISQKKLASEGIITRNKRQVDRLLEQLRGINPNHALLNGHLSRVVQPSVDGDDDELLDD